MVGVSKGLTAAALAVSEGRRQQQQQQRHAVGHVVQAMPAALAAAPAAATAVPVAAAAKAAAAGRTATATACASRAVPRARSAAAVQVLLQQQHFQHQQPLHVPLCVTECGAAAAAVAGMWPSQQLHWPGSVGGPAAGRAATETASAHPTSTATVHSQYTNSLLRSHKSLGFPLLRQLSATRAALPLALTAKEQHQCRSRDMCWQQQ